MNKIFNGRNVIIAVITLTIGVLAAFGAAKMFYGGTTSVTGNVVAFILNPEGRVDGAILDTGDQVKFGAETGEVVTANLPIGAPLTATGHAGTSSNFGRELHAQTLQIGDQTITIAAGKPKGPKDGPKGPKDDKPGKDKPRPPRDGDKPLPPNAETNAENAPESNRPSAEITKVSGTVKHILVNREGKARGVILASGEQLNLGKEVEDANLTINANTVVSAEGETAKSQFGTFVKPKVLTIGNRTFTFNR